MVVYRLTLNADDLRTLIAMLDVHSPIRARLLEQAERQDGRQAAQDAAMGRDPHDHTGLQRHMVSATEVRNEAVRQ